MNAISQNYRRFNEIRGRRVFILPTRFGVLYGGFLVLILLAAINYNNSLGHILCFLLASMGQLTIHYTYRNLAKIELLNATAEPCFLGQVIPFTLRLDNPNQYDCYHLNIASKQSNDRSWNPLKNVTGFRYQPHQAIAVLTANLSTAHRITIASTHRGQQTIGHIRISTRFPVGLFDTWTYFTPDCVALVYPAPIGHLPLPTSVGDGQQHTGSQQRGNDDFAGLQTYREGEPAHAIAWKALARDDILRTKQFSSSASGQIHLSWQTTSSLPDTEARLSQLCRWLLDAENQGLEYSLTLPHLDIEKGCGAQHQQRCLTALALYD
jgi:uncharacterized protein (DUF58 family)